MKRNKKIFFLLIPLILIIGGCIACRAVRINQIISSSEQSIIQSSVVEETSVTESSIAIDEISTDIHEESSVHYAWTVSPIKSTLAQCESSDVDEIDEEEGVEEDDQETDGANDEQEESRGTVTADNETNTRPQTGSNQNSSNNQSYTQNNTTTTRPNGNQSCSTNNSTTNNNTNSSTQNSSTNNSTANNNTSNGTQTENNNSSTNNSSSSSQNSSTDNYENSQTGCSHNWVSGTEMYHNPELSYEQPIYGTKTAIIESEWDEVTGYNTYYQTADGVVFYAGQESALTVYTTDHGVGYSVKQDPIYVHHDAVYGEVPDYDTIVGYETVVIPAEDVLVEYAQCTKCGLKEYK